jgi:putative oxygen-independent coproporphyrinogen III oxidase
MMAESAVPRRAEQRVDFVRLPPLALYLHLPWCVRKCPYCDFNSYETRGAIPDLEYVEAALRDLRAEAPLAQGRVLESIFIGGGTPSLFSGHAIERLLDGVRAELTLAPDTEVTLEANPGAVDTARFAEFRAAGVNRLSIGVQSFRNEQLRALGRVHDAQQARLAVLSARSAGFENFNLDLMYGLPGEADSSGAVVDLECALELAPSHVSWYQLTLEPNTAFERRPPPLPDEDIVSRIEEKGRALLAADGFRRYEISAYARGPSRSRHNLNYWTFGDYLGIGAGAHGKITFCTARALERRARTRNPRTYMLQAGTATATTVERLDSASQIATEFLLNALRLVEGVDVATFEARAGQSIAAIAAPRAAGVACGWLDDAEGWLRATPCGLERLNRLLELFV